MKTHWFFGVTAARHAAKPLQPRLTHVIDNVIVPAH
jgi:hypothetical protein